MCCRISPLGGTGTPETKVCGMRVVRHWHRELPREAVDASSLAVFKARPEGALSNLIECKVSLPMAQGLALDGL